jgi:hypothetical protein
MTTFALKFEFFIYQHTAKSKILIIFGSFLAFFKKNEIWPHLVEFGLFLKVIWLCACAKAYQPCCRGDSLVACCILCSWLAANFMSGCLSKYFSR